LNYAPTNLLSITRLNHNLISSFVEKFSSSSRHEEKKTLETSTLKSTEKQKFGKSNAFLILIQIQNRIKITTTQIEKKNILTRDELF